MTQYVISARTGRMAVDGAPLDLPGPIVAVDLRHPVPDLLAPPATDHIPAPALPYVDVTFRVPLGGYDVFEFHRGEVYANSDGPGVVPQSVNVILCGACGAPFADQGAYGAHTDGVTCRSPEGAGLVGRVLDAVNITLWTLSAAS